MARKYNQSSVGVGFHVPDQQERDAVLPWLMRERKSNISFPLCCVIAVSVGAAGSVVAAILLAKKAILLSSIFIGILLIPSVVICIKNTRTENEKVRRLRDGDVLIADATVTDTGIKRMARYSYVNFVETNYSDDGAAKSQTFIVSKRISRKVKKGSQGVILKYTQTGNTWLDNKMVFLPK